MVGGYMGKILRVDLTSEKLKSSDLDMEIARKYIGGSGLAIKIFWDEAPINVSPLSPENLLIFATGPLTGLVPSSSRYSVATLSPLTDIWGEAHAGGTWADELKRSGFDDIIIKGKAKSPVYISIIDGKAEIRDASHLWGKGIFETDEILKKEIDAKASVAAIGPAGEKLVNIACVINDGKASRAAARCGLGAVMGSKNLKAILVKGSFRPTIFNEAKLKESIRSCKLVRHTDERTAEFLYGLEKDGVYPIKNWSEGVFPGFIPKLVEHFKEKEAFYHCRTCPTSDMESGMVKGERHVVWESAAPLGSECLVDDMAALAKAFSLCNDYGLDSISTGGVIAFGIECYEKGLITKKETDGINLKWGNADALVEVTRKIGEKEGIGALLGLGVKKAAERIGGIAEEYAIHVKGLELPAYDPRGAFTYGIEYATSNRGACHLDGNAAHNMERGRLTLPDLGYQTKVERFEAKGFGKLCAIAQDLSCMENSLTVCKLLLLDQHVVQPHVYVDWLNYVTGWNIDLGDFMKIGERQFNLKRMLNVRRGISRKDDTLPPRILVHKLRKGGAAGRLPPLGEMLNEYYLYRGWSEEGIPTKEKLIELDLLETMSRPITV